MKKKTVTLAVFFVLAASFSAHATPLVNLANDGIEDVGGQPYAYWQNSGQFMFFGGTPGSGNYNNTPDYSSGLLEQKVEAWLGISDPTTFILSADTNLIVSNYTDTGDLATGATKSGTWATATLGTLLDFYVVKAANNYAMYLVNPSAGTGSWSTYDLSMAGYGGESGLQVSHFSGYTSATLRSEVPEPVSMLLFGTGLAGLAGVLARRKNG